ncbi:Phosphoglycerate kinase, partial [Frankliniella fusca]
DDLIKNSKVSIGDILNQSDVTQDTARVEELATNRKYKSQSQIVLESGFLHLNLKDPRFHSPPALLDGLKSIANLLDKRMIGLTFAILDTRIADAEGEDKARLVCLREETLCAFARHGIFGGKGYPVDHISKNFPKLSSLEDLIKNSKVSISDILSQSDVTQDAARVEELATSRKYKSKLERELISQLMQLELSRMGRISQELNASNEEAPGKSKKAKKVPNIELNEDMIDYLKLDEDYETTGNMPPGRPCGGIVYMPIDVMSSRTFQRDIVPSAMKWIVQENNLHYKKHRVKSDNSRQQLIETKVMSHKLLQKQAAPLYVGSSSSEEEFKDGEVLLVCFAPVLGSAKAALRELSTCKSNDNRTQLGMGLTCEAPGHSKLLSRQGSYMSLTY